MRERSAARIARRTAPRRRRPVPASALMAAANATSPPAGGAAMGEVILASSAALVVTTAMLVLGMGHRSGRVALLGRAAAYAERRTGLPGWVALPSAIATA